MNPQVQVSDTTGDAIITNAGTKIKKAFVLTALRRADHYILKGKRKNMKIHACLILTITALQSFGQRMSVTDSTRWDSIMRATQKGNQQDYQTMLDQLHITSTRPGPSGNPQAPNAANNDEAKATAYTSLPDPLVMKNGQRVTTANMWWKKRRPEIVEYFDREMYGRVPLHVPKVKWEVTKTSDTTIGDIKAVTRQLVGHADNSTYPKIKVDIQLT